MTEYNITNKEASWSKLLNQSDDKWEIYWSFVNKEKFPRSVFTWILSVVEIPIMLLTLYAMCFLIKSHRAASVFVIQLILSDLIQIICLISVTWEWEQMLWSAYDYSLIVGVYFMACVAFERYLLVAHPVWLKTHQTLKFSCLISFIVWFVPLISATMEPPYLYFDYLWWCIVCLIPYPVIILCFVGTWRGLSHSISLTSQKRRRILGTLFLVVLSYTFIILPSLVFFFLNYFTDEEFFYSWSYVKFFKLAHCLQYLNPLADCLLYLFMRTDAPDLLKSLHCCCRSDIHQISVRYTTRTTQPSS